MKQAVLGCALALTLSAQWSKIPGGKPDLTAPAPRAADGKPDLSGIWQTDIKYNFDIAADLKPGEVPMQPWAEEVYKQRRASQGAEDPEGYCLPPGVPRIHGVPFPFKIIQTPEVVVILYETRYTHRQIFLDGREVIRDAQPTWNGYSTGKWEGDTLVVTTTGFNGKTWLDDNGHPTTDGLRVTERFRRRDAGHIDLRITIDDPKAYTRPWDVSMELTLVPDTELIEYVCAENNTSIQHLPAP
jgi:hypothetical protein